MSTASRYHLPLFSAFAIVPPTRHLSPERTRSKLNSKLHSFDYGDDHEVKVEVVGIRPTAERGRYSRVVDSRGDAPAQYRWPDGDDDEDGGFTIYLE